MEPLIWVLVSVLVVFVVAWVAVYIVKMTMPANLQTPALIVIGLIALIVLLYVLLELRPISLP